MTRATGVAGGPSADTSSVASVVGDEVTNVQRASDARPGQRKRKPSPFAAALTLTLLPLLVSAIALVLKDGDHMPIGDFAQIELRVRDVGAHTPLVGLWSRERWNHPGPLGFFVLAPTYRLLGSSSIGLYVGALVVNGAALSGIALVARRRGGTPLMLCALVICNLMVLNLGADFLRSPWNPLLPVVSYGLLILLAWSMACGEIWALPAAVAVASFAAQTHVGFVALGAPLLAWGLAGLLWSVRRSRAGADAGTAPDDDSGTAAHAGRAPRRALLSSALMSGAVAIGLWLLPLIDIVINSRTNADMIRRYFTSPRNSVRGLSDGWQVMAAQFSSKAEWLTGREPHVIGETVFVHIPPPLPWLLLPVAGAGVVLWRSGRPGDRALVGTLLVAFGTGIVAVSRTIGQMANYRLQPTWWPAALAGAIVLWVVWRAIPARWPVAERRWLVLLAVAALVVLTGVNSVSAVRSETRHTADSQIMGRLMPDILEAVGPGEGEVLVVEGSHAWSFYTEAIVLQLERNGIDAVVVESEIYGLRFGENRLQDDPEPRATLVVVALSDNLKRWANDPDVVPIATWSAEEDPIDAGRGPIIDRVTVFLER